MTVHVHDVLVSEKRNAADKLNLLSSEHLNVTVDIQLQITIKETCVLMKLDKKNGT